MKRSLARHLLHHINRDELAAVVSRRRAARLRAFRWWRLRGFKVWPRVVVSLLIILPLLVLWLHAEVRWLNQFPTPVSNDLLYSAIFRSVIVLCVLFNAYQTSTPGILRTIEQARLRCARKARSSELPSTTLGVIARGQCLLPGRGWMYDPYLVWAYTAFLCCTLAKVHLSRTAPKLFLLLPFALMVVMFVAPLVGRIRAGVRVRNAHDHARCPDCDYQLARQDELGLLPGVCTECGLKHPLFDAVRYLGRAGE